MFRLFCVFHVQNKETDVYDVSDINSITLPVRSNKNRQCLS